VVVAAIIGAFGLNLDMALEVYPEEVAVIIALASKSSAVVQVALLIALVVEIYLSTERRFRTSKYSSDVSVLMAISCIVFTASTGYFPAAVSPESMMESLPSKIALATSVTS